VPPGSGVDLRTRSRTDTNASAALNDNGRYSQRQAPPVLASVAMRKSLYTAGKIPALIRRIVPEPEARAAAVACVQSATAPPGSIEVCEGTDGHHFGLLRGGSYRGAALTVAPHPTPALSLLVQAFDRERPMLVASQAAARLATVAAALPGLLAAAVTAGEPGTTGRSAGLSGMLGGRAGAAPLRAGSRNDR
jgi:hypothetical protein